MISPFSNYTGNGEEVQVEQARIKALSRSFDKRQQSRKSHLEVVEEADKEGDSGEEGQWVAFVPVCNRRSHCQLMQYMPAGVVAGCLLRLSSVYQEIFDGCSR